jgi:hypothetical protein
MYMLPFYLKINRLRLNLKPKPRLRPKLRLKIKPKLRLIPRLMLRLKPKPRLRLNL